MQKIIPGLWFDASCEEAMNFYVSIFPDSKITSITYYPEAAEDEHLKGMNGKVLNGQFELAGQEFTALDGGPVFTFNPSKSFMVRCSSKEEVDGCWQKLSEGGSALMPLGEYPFSKRYGWVKDKYGLSWQIILPRSGEDARPKLMPSIMFIHENAGKAEEARDFYVSVFKDSQKGTVWPYKPGEAPDEASKVAYEDFQLCGEWFAAMDSGRDIHDFDLNEAVSFIVNCDDQAEIDYYWQHLSAVPESEQCGWCKDKYGISWQIIPKNMGELMQKPDAFKTLMGQHKIVISEY